MQEKEFLSTCLKYKEISKEELESIIAVDYRVISYLETEEYTRKLFWSFVSSVLNYGGLNIDVCRVLKKTAKVNTSVDTLKSDFNLIHSFSDTDTLKKVLTDKDGESTFFVVSFVMCVIALINGYDNCNLKLLYRLVN